MRLRKALPCLKLNTDFKSTSGASEGKKGGEAKARREAACSRAEHKDSHQKHRGCLSCGAGNGQGSTSLKEFYEMTYFCDNTQFWRYFFKSMSKKCRGRKTQEEQEASD